MSRRGPLLCAALALGCASGPGEPPALIRAREGLAASAARSGDLRLTCQPEDAQVLLDGVPQGVCTDFAGRPAGLTLGAGMHRVEVTKEGFLPYVTYLSPSGARTSLGITLQPLRPSEGANP